MSIIQIIEPSLIFLVGPSGCGKSTFAKSHFLESQIVSSDTCRLMVSDDPNNQSCSADAFDLLHLMVEKRLKAGKLTIVDATNIEHKHRVPLIKIARKYHIQTHAIILNYPLELCLEQNTQREDRQVPEEVIKEQHDNFSKNIKNISKREGFYQTDILSPDQVLQIKLKKVSVSTNRKTEKGPFDIIGDIHGCVDELILLLEKLGYILQKTQSYSITHPMDRRPIFVGDLVDRGPNSPEVLRLVMDLAESKQAFCVKGNHDDKLSRFLQGKRIHVSQGMQLTLDQLEPESDTFKAKALDFIQKLNSHYILDEGRLAVCHAGIKQQYLGRSSSRIDSFCMYGDTTGEKDEFGLPIRAPWEQDYDGETLIVYGHTPILEPKWINNTINIDTGCVFGGKLTALRYPEKELVSVDSLKTYYEPVKPIT